MGVRGTATIERVAPARVDDNRGRRKVFVVLRFVDTTGVETVCERELWKYSVPMPGDSYGAACLAGELETSLDYHAEGWRRLDPDVPRGWGAGVFQLEPLGSHVPPLGDPERNDERELFRTGRRTEAEVIHRDDAGGFAARSFHYPFTLTLRVDGREHKVEVRADENYFVPDVGDRIQVAVSSDRSTLALDTDERYYGPPCRVLVWATPPEVAQKRSTDTGAVSNGNQDPATAGSAPSRTPQIAAVQVAALEQMHARGQITAEQLEIVKAQLGA
jgi:hypothetical protein